VAPVIVPSFHSRSRRRATLPAVADGRGLFRTAHDAKVAGDFQRLSATELAPHAAVRERSHPRRSRRYDRAASLTSWSPGTHVVAAIRRTPVSPTHDFTATPTACIGSTRPTPASVTIVKPSTCSNRARNFPRGSTKAYLPPGYYRPGHATRHYPVMFMHTARTSWTITMLLRPTGWEVNVTLRSEIAAGRSRRIIVLACPSIGRAQRRIGLTDTHYLRHHRFQVHELQPPPSPVPAMGGQGRESPPLARRACCDGARAAANPIPTASAARCGRPVLSSS